MRRTIQNDWTLVKVHFEIEGVHNFPQVEDMIKAMDPEGKVPLLDVSFLKHPHRHIFKFDLKIDVFHDDRDIEFIQAGRTVKEFLLRVYPPTGQYGCSNFGAKSCEMLAKEAAEAFCLLYKDYVGHMLVEVSEDGENSAIARFTIKQEQEETVSELTNGTSD